MPKTGYVSVRIDPSLKKEAETIFEAVGVSASEALTMFYKQVTLNQGMPFPIRIPNEETQRALDEARNNPNSATKYASVSEMMKDLWPAE